MLISKMFNLTTSDYSSMKTSGPILYVIYYVLITFILNETNIHNAFSVMWTMSLPQLLSFPTGF